MAVTNQDLINVGQAFNATTPEQSKALSDVYAQFAPTISASSLSQPPAPLNVPPAPTYTPPPTPAPDFGVATAQTAYDQTANDLKAASDQAGQITQRTQALEQQYGVPGLSARLNELNAIDVGYQSDLANLASQTLQSNIQSEGRQAPMFAITGEQAQAQRQAAFLQQNVNIKRAVNNAVIATVQGQLANAQANINRALDLEFKPLQQKIDYLSKFLQINAGNLSDAQKSQLQYQITQQTKAYEDGKANREKILNTLTTATKYGADNATLQAIQNAKTPEEAIIAAGSYLEDPKAQLELKKLGLDMQLTRAQIAKTNADAAKVRSETVAPGATTPATTKQLETVNSIDNILSNPAFNSTFGYMNAINRNFPGSAAYVVAADVNNLISNLALAARGQLKGQGQVSDFEGKLLKDAQTALKINMTPEQARAELTKVKGAIRTSSGLSATVLITDPKTKTSQIVEATQEGINQAIKDGLKVEYK